MSESLVEINAVSKIYKRGAERLTVLDKLSLSVPRGDFVALMGPSGSGKTTLLNLIGGIDRPDGGSIVVSDRRIDKLSDRALAHWRSRHVGFVFQMFNLLPVLTAERNVELPLLLTGMNGRQRRERARTALSLVGLQDRFTHKPAQLSGGQEQRVGIARAIVTDPEILLCDEPTGDLDRQSGDEVLDLLVALNESQGKTIIMVTHDPVAAERAKRIVHLDKGRLSSVSEAAA
ncbi:MAG: ABC transporter ATP-binding protein [Gammaproteobacteria bacterium]|nr:ABC transporter ATP-binding protein [Gammaproteobacteria bacterium]